VAANASRASGQVTYVEMSLRARLRAGDPEAFRRLFDEQATAVYNHAYRLLGDWSAAEDVVSLAFLEAWRLRDRIDCAETVEQSSLRPWLLGIATNVVRNVRRADRRHRGALSRVPRPPDLPDLADEVAAHVDDHALGARISVALAQLRRPDREVLALSAWAGLDHAETAQALGIPVGTVRSRLFRARRRLAGLLADTALPPPREQRERTVHRGQTRGDREHAVRPVQENA
jgi:RNA polymerase sigma factor (sigma-70 family)